MATRSINQQAHREMKLKAEALLPLFNKEFPDEKTTLERIFIASGTKKCECGAELIPDFESRSFECGKCGEDTWLTAKTGFRNVRQLRVYVAAAWFQDRGVKLSGPQLASLMGAPTATCQRAAKRPGVTILEVVKKAPELYSRVLLHLCETEHRDARRRTSSGRAEGDGTKMRHKPQVRSK